MRAALWFISLFGVASVLALFAKTNEATVSIFFPPHRLDMSLNLVLLGLLIFFVVSYLAIRAIRVLLALPGRARDWRAAKHEKTMRSSLMQGVIQLQAGRFTRARASARSALSSEASLRRFRPDDLESAQTRLLANLLAAQSAQALHDAAQRDEEVQQALGEALAGRIEDGQEAVLLRAADWALDERDALAARAFLDQLSKGATRRAAALRLRLRLERLASKSMQALETARLLSKHKAFTPLQARSLMRALALEALAGCRDLKTLEQFWGKLDAAQKGTVEVACQAVMRWLSLGGDGSTVMRWIEPLWQRWVEGDQTLSEEDQSWLVRALEVAFSRQGGDVSWLSRLEGAQKRWPADVRMAYLTAMACWHGGLWGKARQLMSQALPRLSEPELQVRAWQALADLAAREGDQEAATEALQKAFHLGLQHGGLPALSSTKAS